MNCETIFPGLHQNSQILWRYCLYNDGGKPLRAMIPLVTTVALFAVQQSVQKSLQENQNYFSFDCDIALQREKKKTYPKLQNQHKLLGKPRLSLNRHCSEPKLYKHITVLGLSSYQICKFPIFLSPV